MSPEEKVKRLYEVRESTQEWLAVQAEREGRSIIKQVSMIIEAARDKDDLNNKEA